MMAIIKKALKNVFTSSYGKIIYDGVLLTLSDNVYFKKFQRFFTFLKGSKNP